MRLAIKEEKAAEMLVKKARRILVRSAALALLGHECAKRARSTRTRSRGRLLQTSTRETRRSEWEKVFFLLVGEEGGELRGGRRRLEKFSVVGVLLLVDGCSGGARTLGAALLRRLLFDSHGFVWFVRTGGCVGCWWFGRSGGGGGGES